MHRLAHRLRRIHRLLERLRPAREDGDTQWDGPYYVARAGEWHPTRFLRYRDELYFTLTRGWRESTLIWTIGGEAVGSPASALPSNDMETDERLWAEVLEQVERKLKAAVRNPDAYNRRISRCLPMRCREGIIIRKMSWPRAAAPPMKAREIDRLESSLARGGQAKSMTSLCVQGYLKAAGAAYDTVFPDLRKLSPRKKYEARADSRHGGMLDLPPDNSASFKRWFESRRWAGAHPWEIVFAHPHGIIFSPLLQENTWRFALSVDTEGLYVAAARMAIALGEKKIPFEMHRSNKIISAIRGDDEIEVGPFYGQLSLEELEERRPGARKLVAWKEPSRLVPLG